MMMILVIRHQIGKQTQVFNTSTNKFVFGTLGTTVYTADNAKRQSLAKVTLKSKRYC